MKPTPISLLAIVALCMNAGANEPNASPQPVRTIFERHDQSQVTPAREIVIGSAVLPANTAVGYHTHPGDEAGAAVSTWIIDKGQPLSTPAP
jgi:hypothetical protein